MVRTGKRGRIQKTVTMGKFGRVGKIERTERI